MTLNFIRWIIHFKGDKPDADHERELRTIAAQNKEMEHLVEKHSGKRPQESLLEAHQKELKKKRKVHTEVETIADSFKANSHILCRSPVMLCH
jgi:hypothetical protein